jgi:hypothetical protein
MNGVAIFVYADWSALYPQLALWIGAPAAQQYFNMATIYLDNTPTSLVQDVTQRTMLLYMLTSHIAQLLAPQNGQNASPLVGRISDATEGSVTVRAEMKYPEGSAQWYQQTSYGAMYWAATTQYRTMRYLPGPVRNFQPYGAGYNSGFPLV